MITKRQKLLITYYLFRSLFLGIGFSRIFDKTHQDFSISVIIGTILGFFVIKLVKLLLDKKEGFTLKEYVEKSKFQLLFKMLIILFSFVFIIIILTILNSFISSFFLLNSPTYFIIILFLLISYILATRGLKNIIKTAELLFFINFFIPIIVVSILLKYADVTNLLPILTSKPSNIVISSISYCIYSTVPYFFLLNIKNNGKDIDKFYIINSMSIFLIFVFTMLILGRNLTDIYRFPEYVVLKRIKIFSFIEKIENIVSCIWITDEVLSISIALYTVYDFLNKSKMKLVFAVLLIFIFVSFIVGNNYVISLFIYYNSLFILLFGIILLIAILFIKKDGSN